jgi:hypothetical protein
MGIGQSLRYLLPLIFCLAVACEYPGEPECLPEKPTPALSEGLVLEISRSRAEELPEAANYQVEVTCIVDGPPGDAPNRVVYRWTDLRIEDRLPGQGEATLYNLTENSELEPATISGDLDISTYWLSRLFYDRLAQDLQRHLIIRGSNDNLRQLVYLGPEINFPVELEGERVSLKAREARSASFDSFVFLDNRENPLIVEFSSAGIPGLTEGERWKVRSIYYKE